MKGTIKGLWVKTSIICIICIITNLLCMSAVLASEPEVTEDKSVLQIAPAPAGVPMSERFVLEARVKDGEWQKVPVYLAPGAVVRAYVSFANEYGNGWVMVRAENNISSILRALEAGEFYSSCGPEIYNFYIEDNKAVIDCSPVAKIHGFTVICIQTV